MSSLEYFSLGPVKCYSDFWASEGTEVDVAGSVVGLVQMWRLAQERVHAAVWADVVVAEVAKGLNGCLGLGSSELDAMVEVAQSGTREAVAAVGRQNTRKDIVSLLRQPCVPVTNVDIGVESSSALSFLGCLRVVYSAVGVGERVDQEVHVTGRGLSNLQASVRCVQLSHLSAAVGALYVSNPERDASRFFTGTVDVDDTGVSPWNPLVLVDLRAVPARVGNCAGLEIDQLNAMAR